MERPGVTLPLELQQMIIHHTITDALEDQTLVWPKQRSRLVDLAGALRYQAFRQPLEAKYHAQDAACKEVQQAFDLVDKKTSHRTIARWRTAQGLFISEEGAKYDAAFDNVIFNVQRRSMLKHALMDVERHIVSHSFQLIGPQLTDSELYYQANRGPCVRGRQDCVERRQFGVKRATQGGDAPNRACVSNEKRHVPESVTP